jgi:acetyl-CoA carboxylase biotin carboxyl carrier protein
VTLTAKDVAEITRLLEESNFDELYLELDGLKLSLRRGAAANMAQSTQLSAASAPGTVPPALGTAEAAAFAEPTRSSTATASASAASTVSAAAPRLAPVPGTVPPAADDPNSVGVTAPLLGTFYRAPKPGAAPFVEVGSQVEDDTIIGIIEVMKLMNTVRAGVRGKVIQILCRDGALVEYGETLMRVGKTK